jgi:ABC-type lipopolysaccharide export system ATPase subunit
MIILKQDSLLKKFNKKYLTKNLKKSYSHCEGVKRLWQSHPLKPTSFYLLFGSQSGSHRGQLYCPVNSANIKTAPMDGFIGLGIQLQYQPYLNQTTQSIINIAVNACLY